VENGEQLSDTEPLLAARTCAETFGVFYERHFASVLAFFRRRVRGPEEAFDLAAETFAAALASVPRFRPGSEPPRRALAMQPMTTRRSRSSRRRHAPPR